MAENVFKKRLLQALRIVGMTVGYSIVIGMFGYLAVLLIGLTRFLYPFAVAGFILVLFATFLFRRRNLPPVTWLGQLAFLVWGPIYVAGLTMPARALAVTFLPDPWMAPFDVGVAAAGAVVAVLVTARDAAWRRRQLAQLEDLPTSRVAGAAVGLVELRGVARPASGSCEVGATLFQNKLLPFTIEDATGRVKIDPTGARFRPVWANAFEGRGCEVSLPGKTLRDGDPLYVIGSLEVDASGERVVRPRIEPRNSFLWRTLFTFQEKGAEPRRDIQHVFFVFSAKDESEARRHLLNGLRQILILGGIWLILSAVLGALQIPRWISYDAWSASEIASFAPKKVRSRLMLERLKTGDRDERRDVVELLHPYVNEGSVPVLFYALGDRDPVVARKAADQLLSDSGGTTDLYVQLGRPMMDIGQGVRNGLASSDVKVRQLSAMTVAKVSPATAVSDLTPLLRDSQDRVRIAAANGFGTLGPAAHAAMPALRDGLRDPERSVQIAILSAVRSVLDQSPEYSPFFLEQARSADAVVRTGAAGALQRSGSEALDVLLALLRDPAPEVRRAAADSIRGPGKGSRSGVWALMSAVHDEDADVRKRAIQTLAHENLLPNADELVPTLITAMDDPVRDVRVAAARVLWVLGVRAGSAAGRLGEAAVEKDYYVREAAVKALVEMRPVAIGAIPVLIKALDDPEFRRRIAAIEAIGALRTLGAPAAEALARAVRDPEPDIRRQAIRSIGSIGPAGRAAVPALAQLLREGAEGMEWEVFNTLGELGPAAADAVPTMLSLLDSNDQARVESVLGVLSRIGPGAKPSVARLLELLGGKHRNAAMQALKQIGPGDPSTIPALRTHFQASTGWERQRIGELLCPHGEAVRDLFPAMLDSFSGGYGGSSGDAFAAAGAPALDALVDGIKNGDRKRRQLAGGLMVTMGPRAAPAIDVVIAMLDDPDHFFRARACEILQAMGSAAAPARERLVDRLRKRDEVHHSALQALAAMGPAALDTVPTILEVYRGDHAYFAVHKILELPGQYYSIDAVFAALRNEPAGTARACILIRIALKSDTIATRVKAAETLGTWRKTPEVAVPMLVQATRDSHQDVMRAMFRALQSVDPTGNAQLRAAAAGILVDNYPLATESMKILLAAGPGAEPFLPELRRALVDARPYLRVSVATVLGRIGPAARGAEEGLLSLLRETTTPPDVVPVLLALARIGAGPNAVPVIADRMKRVTGGIVAEVGAAVLARIEAKESPEADPWRRERSVFAARPLVDLRTAIRDPHPGVRAAAAERILEGEKESAAALPELTEALVDRSIYVRSLAVRALTSFGPDAAPALPALARALSDPDPEVAGSAAAAIAQTGPAAKAVTAEVIAAFRKGVRQAATAVATIGPDAADLVPDLVNQLSSHPDTEILRALGAIGPASKPAVTKLVAYLEHRDEVVRRQAGAALRQIGPAAEEALPRLLILLGRISRDAPDPVAQALAGIGEPAVPGIVQWLRTGPYVTRARALSALAQLGRSAKGAVPALIPLLRETDPVILMSAINALGAIGPDAREALPHLARHAQGSNNLNFSAQRAIRRINGK